MGHKHNKLPPVHKGGTLMSDHHPHSENAGATCNHSINSILKGSPEVWPGCCDKTIQLSTFSHKSDTINNKQHRVHQEAIGVGYYDASKPVMGGKDDQGHSKRIPRFRKTDSKRKI
ncbi:hypothetical protein IPF89_00880 [Candidatus Saccharibacteria bacterium]|nr:MAG: hypothetical protein IPF89_00880 [Candidatus Saccharibacteria bacterium]